MVLFAALFSDQEVKDYELLYCCSDLSVAMIEYTPLLLENQSLLCLTTFSFSKWLLLDIDVMLLCAAEAWHPCVVPGRCIRDHRLPCIRPYRTGKSRPTTITPSAKPSLCCQNSKWELANASSFLLAWWSLFQSAFVEPLSRRGTV